MNILRSSLLFLVVATPLALGCRHGAPDPLACHCVPGDLDCHCHPREVDFGPKANPMAKVPVCHHRTITLYVDKEAVHVHRLHGDSIGPCPLGDNRRTPIVEENTEIILEDHP